MYKPKDGDFIRLVKSPRADIPAPQYCKVATVIGQDIVAYCFSYKTMSAILTFIKAGEYEEIKKTEYSENTEG